MRRWQNPCAYPSSWFILSAVMLHAGFVCQLCGSHWGTARGWRRLDDHIITTLLKSAWKDVPIDPPDPFDVWNGQWDEDPSDSNDWNAMHYHEIVHCTGFGPEFEATIGKELAQFQAISALEFSMVSPPAEGQTAEGKLDTWQVHVNAASGNSPTFELLFDTGATHSFTNSRSDFVTAIEPVQMAVGAFLGRRTSCEGRGMVRWTVFDDHGRSHEIITEAILYPMGLDSYFAHNAILSNGN